MQSNLSFLNSNTTKIVCSHELQRKIIIFHSFSKIQETLILKSKDLVPTVHRKITFVLDGELYLTKRQVNTPLFILIFWT